MLGLCPLLSPPRLVISVAARLFIIRPGLSNQSAVLEPFHVTCLSLHLSKDNRVQ